MKFSVVVSTRNRDQNLKVLLESLKRQDYDHKNFEVNIINYGGSKETQNVVEDFKSPNFHYFYVDETGIFNESHAKNIGIKKSKGELIICTNADIVFPSHLLREFEKEYDQNGSGYLYQIYRKDLKANELLGTIFERLKNRVKISATYQDETACGDFQAAQRDIWYRVTGYDERMSGWGGMDLDLVDRMALLGIKQKWLNKKRFYIYHTYHPNKAPSKALINLELKKIPKKTRANKRWGMSRSVKLVYVLINHLVSPSALTKMHSITKSSPNTETVFIVNDSHDQLFQKHSHIRVVSIKPEFFFGITRDYAVNNYANYIIEIDFFDSLSKKNFDQLKEKLLQNDCVLANPQKPGKIIKSIAKLIWKNSMYFNVRGYNARLAAVFNHKYFIPTLYFYQPQFYSYCIQLEQDIDTYIFQDTASQSINPIYFLVDLIRILRNFHQQSSKVRRIQRIFKLLKNNYIQKNQVVFNPDHLTNIILGSGDTTQSGFLSTDINILDITNSTDWEKLFKPNTLTKLVAEHVFEHLDTDQVKAALKNSYQYLQPGGRLRIAVPDRNRKDAKYIREVSPPNDGHKSYFDYQSLGKLLRETGFQVKTLEYFNEKGVFIYKKWDPEYGIIRRSYIYDRQQKFKRNNYHYTSLIIDAIKPS